MTKRILVLNKEVSGMNKYLFAGLKSRGWQLNVLNIPFPKRLYYWAAIKGFHFSKKEWCKHFYYHLGRLSKSSWCFQWRSKWCDKQIEKNNGAFDIVLNISGMHAPCVNYKKIKNIKYFVICSYTMALSKKWDEWMTYDHEYLKWVNLEKKLYQNANKVLTTNDNVRYSLEKDYGVPLADSIKIGYGLTFDKFPDFNKKYDGKTILYVGFDFKRKGGFDILEAFKIVKQNITDAKLVIIGPSINIYEIKQEGVDFLGPIKDRTIVQQNFQKASIFVMPSLCEPFGLTFLEAMASKTPCIGTTIDAMPEIIKEGVTGGLVPPRDPKSLAKKMIALLNNKKKLAQMGNNAYQEVKEIYQWNNVVNVVEKEITRRD